jgi:hypothetical protein
MRLPERYVLGLDVLLVVILTYLVTLLANDVVSARAASDPRGNPRLLASVELPAAKSHPHTYYDEIIKRDIFNPPLSVALPVEASGDLHITLLGTSHLSRAKPFIIVRDNRSGQQSLYRLGDDVPDVGRLVAVEKERAVLEHLGRQIALEMPKDFSNSTAMTVSPNRPRSAMQQQQRLEVLQAVKEAGGLRKFMEERREKRQARREARYQALRNRMLRHSGAGTATAP